MKKNQCVLLLATGGTIAGKTISQENPDLYKSGQLGAANLLASSQALDGFVRHRDIAQIDSKEMGLPVWQALCRSLEEAMQDTEIGGVVITHGTDTVEETAFLLHAMGPWGKPVILTCAMRPADHPQADGPAHLREALQSVLSVNAGVWVLFGSQLHHATEVQKIATDPLCAFGSGERGPAAQKIEEQWRWRDAPIPVHSIDKPSMTAFLAAKEWPRVEWLTHRAAAHAQIVHDLLRREPGSTPSLKGLVVAGTGAGTINRAWQNALADAQSEGIWVWLSSRCVWGQALPQADQSVGERTPWPPAKACIAMALAWMASQEKAQL